MKYKVSKGKIHLMKNKESGGKIIGGIQPKHHAPKTRMQSYMRRQKLIEACLTGKPLKDVAIETGLSPKTANDQVTKILREPRVQESFVRILEESGLTDKFLAEKIRSLVDAKTMLYFQKDGVVTDQREVEAVETQRKTLELITKLKGHLQESKQGVSVEAGLLQMVVQVVQQNVHVPTT